MQELAALLYEETNKSELTDLESIEKSVRQQMLEHVSPKVALFLPLQTTGLCRKNDLTTSNPSQSLISYWAIPKS